MRILILGGNGMLGHRLLIDLSQKHSVKVTLRQNQSIYQKFNLFNDKNAFFGVDLFSEGSLESIFDEFKPEVVLNAAAIVKQRSEAKEYIPSIKLNSLFPHQLASLCSSHNARLICFSTDCVFSGEKGLYTEADMPDPVDLYGQTKLLGEVTNEKSCLTLRTSIFGLELSNKKSLIEWFLAQQGEIKGFSNAIYSGISTLEMARLIEFIISEKTDLSGLWHVSSQSISKLQLLLMLSDKLDRKDITIKQDDSFKCDRSLDSSRFVHSTGYQAPNWNDMLDELVCLIKLRKQESKDDVSR